MKFAITNDVRQKGIGSLNDTAPLFQLVDYTDVFEREFTSDVYFVTYGVQEPETTELSGAAFPRLRKTAVSSIESQGGKVLVQALVMDMDLQEQTGIDDLPLDDEEKPLWTTTALDVFREAVLDITAKLKERRIAAPLVYTTLHGARFVHPLSWPIETKDAEDCTRGLIRVYDELGLIMDPACVDWTRFFRAPKVIRKGEAQWEQRWFWIRWNEGLTNPQVLDRIASHPANRYADVEAITALKPSPEEAESRLVVKGKKGPKMSQVARLAEKALKGTPSYQVLFEGLALPSEGSRHTTLLSLVGSATTRLMEAVDEDGIRFEPEDIYALFLTPVEQLRPDEDTPDWPHTLWQMVCHCYEKERAQIEFAAQQRDAERERTAEKARKLIDVVRETCGIEELHDSDEMVAQAAFKRLVLLKEPAGRYRALMQDGSYSQTAYSQGSLHHLIEKVAKQQDLIELYYFTKEGDLKPVSEAALGRQAADIARIKGKAGIERSHITGTSWDDLELHLRLYRLNPDLEPTYSPLVDEWLQVLTTNTSLLLRWLSRALDFSGGPIAALSLVGAPGAGKGLLCQGLVETLEKPVRADKSVLYRTFNSSLQHTPFLIVDEGLPRGQLDIADTFRSLTAGEPILCEEKYQTPIEIRNPLRIIFTANNLDVVQQLASDRVNDAQDQAALAIRLVHLDVTEEAERLLRNKGGLAYTAGWVEGANGSPSDFTLAKHLLWLYYNRADFGEVDKRLQVEGTPDTEIVQGLRITGAVAEAVARAIIAGLDGMQTPAVCDGISIEENRLFVTPSAIEIQHKNTHDSTVQLTAAKITKALRNMATPGSNEPARGRKKTLTGAEQQQRWWDIDVRLLWRYAEKAGYKREQLEKLVTSQYGPNGLN